MFIVQKTQKLSEMTNVKEGIIRCIYLLVGYILAIVMIAYYPKEFDESFAAPIICQPSEPIDLDENLEKSASIEGRIQEIQKS